MEEDTDEDSINYPDEPEDGEEDDDEDPEEDPKEDPSEEHKTEDDNDDDDTDDEDEEPTEDEEEEEHPALADSSVVPVIDPVPSARDTEAFETDESAPTPRSSQTRAPLGHRTSMIRMRDDIPEEDMPPQRRFVLTAPPPGRDVAESSAAAAARAPRAADRAEDVSYVRALQASEHRMMTSIEEVNLRVSYQAQVYKRKSKDIYIQFHDAHTDHRDIRLEIDVVRGQRTAYEIELREVRHDNLSSKSQNKVLLAQIETLETHMSRMEWQRQSAEDIVVKQMMRTQVLEARARIDTVEDAGSSC
ncbi:hypothetical protein Tco_1074462 [Tanacetum coccineum]